jgi:hypothetical protein
MFLFFSFHIKQQNKEGKRRKLDYGNLNWILQYKHCYLIDSEDLSFNHENEVIKISIHDLEQWLSTFGRWRPMKHTQDLVTLSVQKQYTGLGDPKVWVANHLLRNTDKDQRSQARHSRSSER